MLVISIMLAKKGMLFALPLHLHLVVSVCAGVPVKRMVAGVAMGLILEEGGNFQVLTDILGSEDALGDMDFKVAGDAEGVTAFQMDIKVTHPLVIHESSIGHAMPCQHHSVKLPGCTLWTACVSVPDWAAGSFSSFLCNAP